MIYFDYAATCPMDEEAAQVYIKTATQYYGNVNSLHDVGNSAKLLLEQTRGEFAKLLGIPKEGLFFTSGGTESNYLGIRALLSAKNRKGRHIITGIAEHSSVYGTFEKLREEGFEVTFLPLNADGRVDPAALKKQIKDETVLVSIQCANPEIGSVQPVEEIGTICRSADILFHSDFVHAFGKMDIKRIVNYVDSFSISGHKFYGPKGVGAVYVNPKINWKPYYPNTNHEKGFRPGTVNVPAIVSMFFAAEKVCTRIDEQRKHDLLLRRKFFELLEPYEDKFIIYDLPEPYQIPSTIGMRIKGKEGQWVMLECNRFGYCISTGSACHVGMDSPAATMKALQVSDHEAKEFIRISFGKDTTEKDIVGLAKTMINIVHR